EVQLLTSIEEADIIRRTLLCIGGVLLYLLHPFCVRIRPGHYRTPVLDFDEQEKQEGQTEPRVEKACHRTAPKERSNPVKKPRAVNRESGQQRKREGQSHHPVHKADVRRMAL